MDLAAKTKRPLADVYIRKLKENDIPNKEML